MRKGLLNINVEIYYSNKSKWKSLYSKNIYPRAS